MLRQVARILDSEKRRGDIVARYGGEEFVALLSHADSAAAQTWAERVRARLSTTAIDLGDGQGLLRVTASFGVASAAGVGTPTPGELLQSADRALYEAKAAGRNRVEVVRRSDRRAKESGRRLARLKLLRISISMAACSCPSVPTCGPRRISSACPAGVRLPLRMTLIRLPKGGLVVHSPLPLNDDVLKSVARVDAVEYLIAPSNLHHRFAGQWVQRFPGAKLYGAPGLSEEAQGPALRRPACGVRQRRPRRRPGQRCWISNWWRGPRS